MHCRRRKCNYVKKKNNGTRIIPKYSNYIDNTNSESMKGDLPKDVKLVKSTDRLSNVNGRHYILLNMYRQELAVSDEIKTL